MRSIQYTAKIIAILSVRYQYSIYIYIYIHCTRFWVCCKTVSFNEICHNFDKLNIVEIPVYIYIYLYDSQRHTAKPICDLIRVSLVCRYTNHHRTLPELEIWGILEFGKS